MATLIFLYIPHSPFKDLLFLCGLKPGAKSFVFGTKLLQKSNKDSLFVLKLCSQNVHVIVTHCVSNIQTSKVLFWFLTWKLL